MVEKLYTSQNYKLFIGKDTSNSPLFIIFTLYTCQCLYRNLFVYLYKYVYFNYFILQKSYVLLWCLSYMHQNRATHWECFNMICMLSIKFTKGMRLYIIGRTRMCFKVVLQHSMVFI